MRPNNILIFLTMVFTSCSYQQGSKDVDSNYFSLDSLVESQVTQLIILSPSLKKEAFLDEAVESTLLQ